MKVAGSESETTTFILEGHRQLWLTSRQTKATRKSGFCFMALMISSHDQWKLAKIVVN